MIGLALQPVAVWTDSNLVKRCRRTAISMINELVSVPVWAEQLAIYYSKKNHVFYVFLRRKCLEDLLNERPI